MSASDRKQCPQSEMTCAYALQALPASEITATEAHIASCLDCQRNSRHCVRWSTVSPPGPPTCCVPPHRCRRAWRCASPKTRAGVLSAATAVA